MPTLSNQDLLQIWEYGSLIKPHEYGRLLLTMGMPELDAAELPNMTIGERDKLLLQLRGEMFGSRFDARVPCEQCGEKMEVAFDVADIMVEDDCEKKEREVELGNHTVRYRVLAIKDLDVLSSLNDGRKIEECLFSRCLLEIRRNGSVVDESDLSASEKDTIIHHIAQADPQSEVLIKLECPYCQTSSEVVFDIVSYVHTEINHYAQRLLLDVHYLSASYGWREKDILAMSAHRRQAYIDVITA